MSTAQKLATARRKRERAAEQLAKAVSDLEDAVIEARREGMSVAEIAAKSGIDRSRVYVICSR